MYWYTVGHPISAGIFMYHLKFRVGILCTIPKFEQRYLVPSLGMYWDIPHGPKFGLCPEFGPPFSINYIKYAISWHFIPGAH